MTSALALAVRDGAIGRSHAVAVETALRARWPDIEITTHVVGPIERGPSAGPGLPSDLGAGRAAALEAAVRRGSADVAVIPFDCMPTASAAGLRIAAVPPRGDPRDALVARPQRVFTYLPAGSRIGTTGEERRAQLLRRRSDLVLTLVDEGPEALLARLDAEEFDAVVTSAAALHGLGARERIAEYFETDLLIPVPGQGALALEVREDDARAIELLAPLDDQYTAYAVLAERTCVRGLRAPQAPIAVHAATDGELMSIHGIVLTPDGAHAARLRWSGPWREPEDVGATLAELLLAAGGREILAGQPLESTSRYTFRPAGSRDPDERLWRGGPAPEGTYPDEER